MPFIPVDPLLVADCADALRQKYGNLGTVRQGVFDIEARFIDSELREVAECVIRRAAERGRITKRGGA